MEFVASLIAITGLAEQVISCCRRYASAVKDCPSDLRGILIETSSLKSAIENLEFLYNNTPDPVLKQHFARLNSDDGPIGGCHRCLQELENLLPNDRSQEENGKKRKMQHPTLDRLA